MHHNDIDRDLKKMWQKNFKALQILISGHVDSKLPLLPFNGVAHNRVDVDEFHYCQLNECNKNNICDDCQDLTECLKLYDSLC